MTYSYDVSNDIGKVRMAIADVASPYLFTDEEIQVVLTTYGNNVLNAAASLCDSLASRYGRLVTQSVDGASFSYGERAKFYLDMATRLRAQARNNSAAEGLGNAFISGVSKGEMDAVTDDTDRFATSFGVGAKDNKALQ